MRCSWISRGNQPLDHRSGEGCSVVTLSTGRSHHSTRAYSSTIHFFSRDPLARTTSFQRSPGYNDAQNIDIATLTPSHSFIDHRRPKGPCHTRTPEARALQRTQDRRSHILLLHSPVSDSTTDIRAAGHMRTLVQSIHPTPRFSW